MVALALLANGMIYLHFAFFGGTSWQGQLVKEEPTDCPTLVTTESVDGICSPKALSLALVSLQIVRSCRDEVRIGGKHVD